MPTPDPFDELGLGTPNLRRRDLREKSTRHSRKAARKRAAVARTASSTRPSSGPRTGKLNAVAARKKPLRRRVAAKLFAIVALSFVLLLVLAQTLPYNLFLPATASASSALGTGKHTATIGQSVTASGDGTMISRDQIQAMSSNELAQLQAGAASAGYIVNNSGPIRWPFDFAVPLGDRFGKRAAPCAGCSTFHHGTDFETGDAAPIYAVAAGTVTVSDFDGSLGQTVSIDHNVNGLVFTSVYGHMTAGSEKVQVGDKITKGELIGLTGSTGASTGPHLFLEIDINGSPIDSFVWMKAHTAH